MADNYPCYVYNSADMLEIFLEDDRHVVRSIGNGIDVMVSEHDRSKIVGVIIHNVSKGMETTLAREMAAFRSWREGLLHRCKCKEQKCEE